MTETKCFRDAFRDQLHELSATMAPRKKKEYSNDLREVGIKHFLNGDSEREIACKVLIPRSSVNYMITKYKSMKCIGNMIERGRKQKQQFTLIVLYNVKSKLIVENHQHLSKLNFKPNLTLLFLKQQFVDELMKLVYMDV